MRVKHIGYLVKDISLRNIKSASQGLCMIRVRRNIF